MLLDPTIPLPPCNIQQAPKQNTPMAQTTKPSERLVIIGSDHKTEWMLPWFLKHYRDHNLDLPLKLIDFGLSTEARFRYGDILYPVYNPVATGWWNKPFAIQAASRSRPIVWLDLDCEVRGSIRGIFDDYCRGSSDLAIAKDDPWTSRRESPWYNSGVLGIPAKCFGVDIWCMETSGTLASQISNNTSSPLYGDQDVLSGLINSKKVPVVLLPKIYNTLRLDFVDNTAPPEETIIIKHWTGKKGKDHIKQWLAAKSS